jgi:hypothetical protein
MNQSIKKPTRLVGGLYQDYEVRAKFGKTIDLPEQYEIIIRPLRRDETLYKRHSTHRKRPGLAG